MKARENPFASHIISTIEYRFAEPHDLEQLLEQFEKNNRRGAIVGPHGSGKTTLLKTIRAELESRGFAVDSCELQLTDGSKFVELQREHIVIIDGAEQISNLKWWLLMRNAKRAGVRGIIITAHSPQKLPTIYQTRPSEELFCQFVSELASESVSKEELSAVYNRHNGNVREALMEMYDRFSRRSEII